MGNIKFDMRIVKLPTGWHNILHYTTGGNQNRIPGLWLNSKKGRPYIHIVMGKHNKDITLEMNKDYSINLVARKGVFYVHVNSSGLWKVKTGSMVYRNVKYYMSDPWYASAADVATFGTIQVATGDDPNGDRPHTDHHQLIRKNNLVQTLDTWGPDFNIKFHLRIVKLPTGWHNILH